MFSPNSQVLPEIRLYNAYDVIPGTAMDLKVGRCPDDLNILFSEKF